MMRIYKLETQTLRLFCASSIALESGYACCRVHGGDTVGISVIYLKVSTEADGGQVPNLTPTM